MTKQYLFEVGMEEIPARFLLDLRQQFETRVRTFLEEERLGFDQIKSFATPRRLAVLVSGIADKQEDFSEIAKGPSMTIAKDAEGNWTKAALGFMKGQGVDEGAAFVKEIKGIDYLHVNKFTQGQSAEHVLTRINRVLQEMTFPVTMYWNKVKIPFIRPVHWMVSLLDSQVIPFEFVGVRSDRQSRGHRFLGKTVDLQEASDYETILENEYVIVDFDKRQRVIRDQIIRLGQEKGWQIPIDQDLLDEVTSIVEWPTVFYGDFEPDYLKVPEIVLITAMKDHQRYFYAKDSNHQLLPVFISVRNGNGDHLENVVKGNKKVLRARLEDALFFYREDLSKPLDYYLDKLNHVNEHFKLGSLGNKQERVVAYINDVAEFLPSQTAGLTDALAAARVYKYDLMTQTVGEFDELQGEIGAIYGDHYQLGQGVCQAIREQYLPKSSGGILPQSPAGILLTIADKLDTLINYFSVGLIPTGSNDPYGLRRQATGLVEIIESTESLFDLKALIQRHPLAKESQELVDHLVDFIKARIVNALEKNQVDFDVIKAVEAGNNLDINLALNLGNRLAKEKHDKTNSYRQMVEAMTRVVNLGIKVEQIGELSPELAQTKSEEELIRLVLVGPSAQPTIEAYAYHLVQPIENYFMENMVNDSDEKLRKNRLALMKLLTDQVIHYFDPRELLSKF